MGDTRPFHDALRLTADKQRLDWLEANPQMEMSHEGWDDDPRWQVHAVHGGRNDREWYLRGEGRTIREAIDAARANKEPPHAR